MAKVKVTVTSSTKQAYNSAMLGARTLKLSRDVSYDQKMTQRAKVKVTMTFRTAYVSSAMYNKIQVSDIGPSWPSCLKMGTRMIPKTIGGITLIINLWQIYSQILLNRITKWTDIYEKLSKNQFGFQKGKSTIDCISALYSIITSFAVWLENILLFLDYEKTFDRVDRSILWRILIYEIISSRFVYAIRSMYKVVNSCIRYISMLSGFFI